MLIGIAGLLAAAVGGCGGGSSPSDDGRVEFHPLERSAKTVEQVEVPDPPTDLEENPEYRKIIEGFRNNAAPLFDQKGAARRISQIQSIFVSTGKYLEFVAILQDVVDELGVGSSAATRLAWAYLRLGQERQARELLERLRRERPDDPKVLMVEGSFWFERARQSRVAMARATIAWRRALELSDSGGGRMPAMSKKAVRQRVQLMEKRLSRPAEEIVARAEQKEKGVGGPEGSQETDEQPKGARAEAAAGASKEQGSREPGSTGEEPAGAGEEPGASAGKGDAEEQSGDDKTPVPVLVSRGDMALSNGDYRKAHKRYRRALERDSDNIGARFGLVRARWNLKSTGKEKYRKALRQILGQRQLTAREAYEIGLFAGNKLEVPDLKERFWKRARELDPDYADRVGIPE